MGYESKFIFAERWTDGSKKVYFKTIIEFNGSSFPNEVLHFFKVNGKPVETEVLTEAGYETTDRYGEAILYTAKLLELQRILEDVVTDKDYAFYNYRKIYPLIAILRAITDHKEQWEDICILHYGY